MGLADRDYYREPPSTGIGLRMPESIVNTLVIANVVVFLINLFLTTNDQFMDALTITPDVLFRPWLWWRFVSYGFAHDPTAPFPGHLVGNMFGLWMFGRDIEKVYGPREFLRIYLATIVLCSLFWVLKESVLKHNFGLLGASGAVTAVIILYCLHFPRRTILLMAIIPMPAWVFGIMFILMNLFQFGGSRIAYDVHLVGAAFAFGYYKFGWNLGRFVPFPSAGGRGGGSWKKAFRRKPKLRVHAPDEQYQSLDLEADRVLDKLHSQGEESLTAQERRVLENYSRRMQQKLR